MQIFTCNATKQVPGPPGLARLWAAYGCTCQLIDVCAYYLVNKRFL
jgi:hypothetical protein